MFQRSLIGLVALAIWFLPQNLSAQEGRLTLEKLQKQLSSRQATWKAEDPGFDLPLFEREDGTVTFGLIESEEDRTLNTKGGWLPRQRNSLPPRIDWRNHLGGRNWLPPVRNQGQCGSCTAFAAVGLIETQINIAAGEPDLNIDLSEQNLFGHIGRCSRGSIPVQAMHHLRNVGVPDEVCQPYVSGRRGEDQNTTAACQDISTRRYRVSSYQGVAQYNLKWALQYGPVLTTMMVYEDFKFYKSGVYTHVTGAALGGHAVLLVGFDDTEQAWIVRNSWGPHWGEDGYFRISYNARSGFGLNNYRATVTNIGSFTKISEPETFSAIEDLNSHFILQPFGAAAQNARGYNIDFISVQQPQNVVSRFTVAPGDYESHLDLSSLADGAYIVRLADTNTTTSSYRSYSQIILSKSRPQSTVSIKSNFDINQPVSGKVKWSVVSQSHPVPFTAAEIHIMDTNHHTLAKYVLQDPGKQSDIQWESNRLANGEYMIKAKAFVGTLYEFESDVVEFRVKN